MTSIIFLFLFPISSSSTFVWTTVSPSCCRCSRRSLWTSTPWPTPTPPQTRNTQVRVENIFPERSNTAVKFYRWTTFSPLLLQYSVVLMFLLSATINLQHIGEQAEAMFGVGYVDLVLKLCFRWKMNWTVGVSAFLVHVCWCSKGNSILEVDDEGGRMFLRVLTHLTMHDYPPLVSGALQLLFRHFSQRQEVLQTFKQVPVETKVQERAE